VTHIDIDQERAREPATCDSHEIVVGPEGRFDFFLERAAVCAQDFFRIRTFLFDGLRLLVQRVIGKIRRKQPFGTITHIHSQYIERSDLRIRASANGSHFAMLPIQCRKDDVIPDLKGLFRKIRLPARLTTLLRGKAFRANTLINVDFTAEPNVNTVLRHEVRMALFHVAQEALSNAAKHSQATSIAVALYTSAEGVVLSLKDNGRGFDMAGANRRMGYGLLNMQDRVAAQGGRVEVNSQLGEGTRCASLWAPPPDRRIIRTVKRGNGKRGVASAAHPALSIGGARAYA
jgi:hypothetical protein